MELVAHRGCADHNPENTVAAIRAAAAHLPAVEVDVRRCGSGELIVFHDERVDDVTDGTGRLADLDWETVRGLRVDGSEETIPAFREILDTVPADVTLQVELKEPGLASLIRDDLAGSGLDIRLSSFEPAALAEVARLDWEIETGLLFGDHPAANLDLAAVLGCENVHPHVDQCLTTDVVDRAHERGFRVLAWGLDDPNDADSLRTHGVDGVTTDTWDIET